MAWLNIFQVIAPMAFDVILLVVCSFPPMLLLLQFYQSGSFRHVTSLCWWACFNTSIASDNFLKSCLTMQQRDRIHESRIFPFACIDQNSWENTLNKIVKRYCFMVHDIILPNRKKLICKNSLQV